MKKIYFTYFTDTKIESIDDITDDAFSESECFMTKSDAVEHATGNEVYDYQYIIECDIKNLLSNKTTTVFESVTENNDDEEVAHDEVDLSDIGDGEWEDGDDY